MQRVILPVLMLSAASLALSQSADSRPKFVAADVHAAPAGVLAMRSIPVHDGRYELRNATMVNLVRTAYGFDADKVVGGPSWLEMDRFGIVAKLSGETSPDDQKLMLQSLLEDRFKLLVHKETKPLPGFALAAAKRPQLKPAAGSEETGCKPQSSSGPAPQGGAMLMMGSPNGTTTTIALGPGMTITYNCRNITVAAFAKGLSGMFGSNIGTSPVTDETALEGAWNFDVSFSLSLNGMLGGPDSAERVTLAEALEKQLGLKLVDRPIPTPVIVVDSVNRTPTDNPPDLATILPPLPPPTQFDVASVKPTDPSSNAGRIQVQQGRFTAQGQPLSMLLILAFRDPDTLRTAQIVGQPGWASSRRFDITAKAPPDAAPLDMFSAALPVRALLVERFKLAYHTEQQPATAYILKAAKPKMKKADPASRSSCKRSAAPAGSPGGSQLITCQNITMAQFADSLTGNAIGLNGPVSDGTGLEGGWDFTVNFNLGQMVARPADAAPPTAGAPTAAEPTAGYTIAEAVEKELGLKLETTKKPQPVIVIDHLEEKPTEDQ